MDLDAQALESGSGAEGLILHSPRDDILRLLSLYDLFAIENSLPVGHGVEDAVSSQDRTGAEHGIAAHFGPVADDGPEFSKSGFNDFSVVEAEADVFAIQPDVRTNHPGTEMGPVPENGITHVVEMRHFAIVEEEAVFEFGGVAEDTVAAGNHILAKIST